MSNSVSTLLTRNLHDVFGENDPARRRADVQELYTEDGGGWDDVIENLQDLRAIVQAQDQLTESVPRRHVGLNDAMRRSMSHGPWPDRTRCFSNSGSGS
jgi:hypothetical protein